MKEIEMMAGVDSAMDRANWAELLLMVYDRLVLDVQRGLEAQRRENREETMGHLTHALEIVSELQRSMRVEEHRGGYDLAALYEFLHRRLVMASVGLDTAVTDECLRLVTDLCMGWREAVEELAMAAAERRSA
ncbi:flagellar secretion chaperone FliS [Marmoricola sp. URHA0025 HA25]